jgi:hypothetical protein
VRLGNDDLRRDDRLVEMLNELEEDLVGAAVVESGYGEDGIHRAGGHVARE